VYTKPLVGGGGISVSLFFPGKKITEQYMSERTM
jgi:hypothetical protein